MSTIQERKKKLKEFCERFSGHRRMGMPEYIANQKNEGRPLEPVRHETKGHDSGPSERAQIAARVKFSKDLLLRSTNAQIRAYSFQVADQVIAQRRKNKAMAANA